MRYILTFEAALNNPLVQNAVQMATDDLRLLTVPHPLCKGGQSVIFVGTTEEGRTLLVKVPSFGIRPPEGHWLLRRLIMKEGLIFRSVDCTALPKVYKVHPEGEYLARDYVEGQSLTVLCHTADATARKKLLGSLLLTASILFKTFHDNDRESYVIRDIKPDNIVVPDRHVGILKLIDVGSCRPEHNMISLSPDISRLGTGKWLHWAPEQLLEQQVFLDRRADYFSLGVTCYFVLTGHAPYTNLVADTSLVLTRYMREYEAAAEITSSKCRELDVCEEVISFLTLCFHPRPDNRPKHFIQPDYLCVADYLQ